MRSRKEDSLFVAEEVRKLAEQSSRRGQITVQELLSGAQQVTKQMLETRGNFCSARDCCSGHRSIFR